MQVDLELAEQVPVAEIQNLEASVTAAGLHKVADLEIDPLKTTRHASFVVVVGDKGAGGFVVELSVRALGHGGAVVAHGTGSFAASGDACNSVSLRLSSPAGDGGPSTDMVVLDAGGDTTPTCGPSNCLGCCQPNGVCAPGTGDKLCGSKGAACVDCTSTGGTCEKSTCTSCMPQCIGKACGAADGCGGTCGAGSGCCAPPLEPCSGVCVDTSSDPKHCGACNKACAPFWLCANKVCVCDPNSNGSCTGTSQFCKASSGQCVACDKGTFNCDGKGGCECVGKCTGTTCDTSCTYGVPNQCGSVYHECTNNGVCALCPAGMKNCDQQSGCGTPEGTPCT